MVIEHTFVTTLEAGDAMRLAADFLSRHGFVTDGQNAFQIGQTEWTSLEMHRGKTSIRRCAGVIERPQKVRVDFDRGRIVVAAMIESRRRSFWTGVGGELTATSPKGKPYAELLTTIVTGLEQLLSQQQPLAEVTPTWDHLDLQLIDLTRGARRRSRIILSIAILFVVGAISLMIAAIAGILK